MTATPTAETQVLDQPRPEAEAERTAGQYDELVQSGYEHGFVTEIESDTLPPGLDEDVIRIISQR